MGCGNREPAGIISFCPGANIAASSSSHLSKPIGRLHRYTRTQARELCESFACLRTRHPLAHVFTRGCARGDARARAPAQRHESVGCALASAVGKRWPQKLRKLFRGFVYRYVCVCAAYIFHKEFFRVSRCYFLASMYKRMYICGCNNLKFAYSIILDDTVRTNLVFLQ